MATGTAVAGGSRGWSRGCSGGTGGVSVLRRGPSRDREPAPVAVHESGSATGDRAVGMHAESPDSRPCPVGGPACPSTRDGVRVGLIGVGGQIPHPPHLPGVLPLTACPPRIPCRALPGAPVFAGDCPDLGMDASQAPAPRFFRWMGSPIRRLPHPGRFVAMRCSAGRSGVCWCQTGAGGWPPTGRRCCRHEKRDRCCAAFIPPHSSAGCRVAPARPSLPRTAHGELAAVPVAPRPGLAALQGVPIGGRIPPIAGTPTVPGARKGTA